MFNSILNKYYQRKKTLDQFPIVSKLTIHHTLGAHYTHLIHCNLFLTILVAPPCLIFLQQNSPTPLIVVAIFEFKSPFYEPLTYQLTPPTLSTTSNILYYLEMHN